MDNIAVVDKVYCQICGKELDRINYLHLRNHNISVKEYVKQYPDVKITNDRIVEFYRNHSNHLKTLNIGRKCIWTNERREKHKLSMQGIKKKGKENSNYGKKYNMTPQGIEAHRKLGLSNIGKKHRPEDTEKRALAIRGKTYEEIMGIENAAKLREIRKHAFDNASPEIMAKFRKPAHIGSMTHAYKMKTDKEYAKRFSQIMKNVWNNANDDVKNEWVMRARKAVAIRPNKPETYIINLLNFLYPNEWKYVGDGEVVIGGFNPDIINCNGQKKIIEVYGIFWHGEKIRGHNRKQEENRKVKKYAEFGYKTLIIWENELRNTRNLVNKITKFAEGV